MPWRRHQPRQQWAKLRVASLVLLDQLLLEEVVVGLES